MPESALGVCYIREYLKRLLIENHFLSLFYAPLERTLLANYYGDFREPLVNLYEPVAACALGLRLTDGGIRTLCLTRGQEEKLRALFSQKTREQTRALLSDAARDVNAALGLTQEEGVYFSRAAAALCPRIRAVPPGETLDGVFPCERSNG